MNKKVTQVVIPEKSDTSVNLVQITPYDAVVAYNGDEFIGFVLHDEYSGWFLRNQSGNYEYPKYYLTLYELIEYIKNDYKDLNLVILNKL